MSPTSRLILLFLIVAVAAPSVSAQVQPGTPPFGSFGGGPDVINLANLNAHWSIPVLYKPGRGTNFAYDLSYDSSVWYPLNSSGNISWQPTFNWGWIAETATRTGYISYSRMSFNCDWPQPPFPQYVIFSQFVYYDPWGASHPFSGQMEYDPKNCDLGTTSTLSSLASDGSGYSLSAAISNAPNVSSATITTTAGQVTSPPRNGIAGAATVTDRNGNQITSDGSGNFYDTLSSTTAVLTYAGSGTPGSPITFSYTAPSGASASYTMKYTTYSMQTAFGCSGITDYGTNGTTTANLVSEIDLPDWNASTNPNSKYTFTYESTPGHSGFFTGRLASVTLPTGGTISYSYSGGSNGISCTDGSAATLTRTTPDGTWTYAQVKGTGAASTTTVTDPQGNNSVIQFQGIYETQRQVYQGSTSGTLLLTTNTCYNGAASPCNGTAITQPLTQRAVITTLPNNLQSKHVDSFNTFGVPTETDDYDYGSGAPGSLLRKTTITYAPLGNNITAFRQTATVYNGSGTQVALTNYNYDETAVTVTSGTPQHVSVSGSRGNLTSINYPVSGLTAHSTYYDTGTVNTSADVNGAVTTFNYSSNSCGNSFPISVSEPLSLSESMTWNCTGGVQLTATDENNQTTTTTYNDAYFWRTNAVTDQLGNQTNLYYQPNSTYPSPPEVASFLTFNNGNSQVSDIQYKDGLGRTYVDQKVQSPGSSYLDSVSYTFDSNGRPYSTSVPCATGWTGTCSTPKTTQTYDALNRPLQTTDGGGGTLTYSYPQNDVLVTIGPAPAGENTKQRQLEYDSLGRLTSVCEITSAAGSGTCGQTNTQTGYWTKYTYDALGNLTGVTQNAQASSGSQQARSYTFDAMSRLSSETNPETGTTNYTYDSDSTCGTSSGDLVKRTDAIGNVTCTAYDALHRPTSITYPSGSYASVTPSKYFVYDNPCCGWNLSNTKRRLWGGHTCFSPCSSLITDVVFSFTPRGEVSDVYESTPHSGGYYHTSATYWANGALNSLSSPTYCLNWNVDGEGRMFASYGTTCDHPLASTYYDAAGHPTQVNLGSGDSDTFSYDPNTGRMKQFKFNVGTQSQSLTGGLTWNANGTLGQLAITDQFNSADTQTCNYSHDDLVRIASANCGSAAAQSFSFDPFGNISKSGSPYSFQPSYSAATNRMTSIAGFTPTFDNNGNVTNDSNHTYSWDVDGNSIAIDSVGLTYDAFNRIVEQNRSGSYTQIVYSPTGFKMQLMNGQSVVKEFAPLPGGAMKVYVGGGYYRHSDWLGSARLTSSSSQAYLASLAYAPFGETYVPSGTTDPSFTGMNPDTVSTDYDFPARPYSVEGRWPTPDPAGLAAVDPTNPQSWNRYGYVLNNPVALIDPTGLCGDLIWTVISSAGTTSGTEVGPCPWSFQPWLTGDASWMCSWFGMNCGKSASSSTGGNSSGPANKRVPNQITCNTVLPNGLTVGSYVSQLSNNLNQQGQVPTVSTPYGPAPNPSLPSPVSVAQQVYSGTNFRAMFGGPGANYALLGDAGNFAYGAVSANIGVPFFATEMVAGAYSLYAHPSSDWGWPYGMDPSARVQVPAGYSAQCKK